MVCAARETIQTPSGPMTVEADECAGLAALVSVRFGEAEPTEGSREARALLREAMGQLRSYMLGELQAFHIPLRMAGTPFQQRVWTLLCDIPFGQTISYGELARRVGDPGAARAVGAANGANPLAIIVPCHRVVNARGQLHGYAGGLDRKAWLIDHERRHAGLFAPASTL